MNAAASPQARTSRWVAAAVATVSVLTLASGRSAAQTLANVHVSSASVPADAGAQGVPTTSDDGRYVAFASSATNLIGAGADTNGEIDIFVRDRTLGTTVRVSVSSAGAQANGLCIRPAVSGTGRYVVFMSTATNLVAADTNGLPDVFRHDRDTDADGVFDEPGFIATIRASVSDAEAQSDGASLSYGQAVSDDGNRIAFESDGTNLVPGDTNASTDIFVRDVTAGTTVRVSVSATGAEAVFGAQNAAISGNGRWVVFNDGTGNNTIIPGDANNASDVYRVDLTGIEAPRLISRMTSGAQADLSSFWPSVSDDGNRIAFQSFATNLAGGDLLGFTDVFVYQVSDSTTRRVSQRLNGQAANAPAEDAWISGDGNLVSFTSDATNLVPFDDNGTRDVYAFDFSSGGLARVSRALDGGPGNGGSGGSTSSDDGTVVAFLTGADDLIAGDVNGVADVYVRTDPLLGPAWFSTPADPSVEALSPNPVSISVSGPVAEQTEGVAFPRGGPFMPPAPPIPMNPYAEEIRRDPVLQAAGIDSPLWPGDVADYDLPGIPSEGALFQSAPAPAVGVSGGPPDGTINQVLDPLGIGLAAGPPLPYELWGALPPMATLRDNVDAVSFGGDYFPPVMTTGFSIGLPPPPTLPGGDVATVLSSWELRTSLYAEPIVTFDSSGVVFQFSVDPWAVGAPATAVATEAGTDLSAGGPARWVSPGEAAGDVFESERLRRFAGATVGAPVNRLLDDNNALGLRPDSLSWPAMEDNVDALESTGENVSWVLGMPAPPGELHARVTEFGAPEPPAAGFSSHEANSFWPVFFSVSRNSPGMPLTAVRASFVMAGGSGADIFVAAKNPADPLGMGTNLLFIDNFELGLMTTDDLDALILWVCPELRPMLSDLIAEIAAGIDGSGAIMGAVPGLGMTLSITKYLGGALPDSCIRVGFSVTSESIGVEYSAVDWETGPVFPPGGISAAAGDVFFAQPDGTPINTNWLWHEEADLGLDPGSYVISALPGPVSLATRTDNLDGLDSNDSLFAVPRPPSTGVGQFVPSRMTLATPVPSPFRSATTFAFALPSAGHTRLVVFDALGRRVATLADHWLPAGPHRVVWRGLDGNGARVASGLYLARLESGGERRAVKVLRMK